MTIVVIEETATEAATLQMQSNFGEAVEKKQVIDTVDGPTPKAEVTTNLTDTLTGILNGDYNLDEEKSKTLNAKY